ncbi:signal peptidase I [Nanoarchaeota archaeon]
MNLRIIMVMLAFLAGILAMNLYTSVSGFSTPTFTGGFEFPSSITGSAGTAMKMPKDRVEERQIGVFQDKVVIDIQNAEWSTFTPTKSMLPIIDQGANAIQVKPQEGCFDIEVGDIISYESKYADGIIIHRVVMVNEDDEGTYFIAKGDSNPSQDPGKIRCNQILRVLIAVIY